MAPQSGWTRRRFLEIAGIAGGVVGLRQFMSPMIRPAHAAGKGNLFLLVYFGGGWDQLVSLDPRDNTDPRFRPETAYNADGSGIYPAYELLTDATTRALLGTNAPGVQTKGNLTFGPAVPASLMDHYQDLCIVRGVTMDTLTHEVGLRYFLTGKFPRGLAASGSSIPTAIAAAEGMSATLPNLAVGTEAYNETFPAFASAIRVNSSADLLAVLQPLGRELSPTSKAALEAFESTTKTCEHQMYDGDGLVSFFRASRTRAQSIVQSNVAKLFQFNPGAPAPEAKQLMSTLAINTAGEVNGPKGRAAIAGMALQYGVSQAVSLVLANGLDDHVNWDTEQVPDQRASFDALGNLIKYLKSVPYKDTNDSVWSRTTMMVFSEFSRTPLINSRNGRDHHLASSCLIAGPGIKGNTVIGATSDVKMAVRPVDLATGQPDDGGVVLRPADIHATLFKSMGLGYDHITNQVPQIVTAMLK